MTDTFTSAVLQAGLDSAAEEMFEVLRKTAMSPIIYEVLDVGTGVTDAEGALVSSGAGIPSFVGVLDKTVKAIIAKEGDRIIEGDVFITNDPNSGGVTHLNDIVVAEPVFHNGQRVAWVASIAHWGDIGGKTPGSMAVDVTEIFAEGLRLPIARLFDAGRLSDAVFDIIRCNSRLPDFVSGDLWAQISAGRRAAGLIRSLCDRYSAEAMRTAIADARNIGLARAKAGLAKLPKGKFQIDEPQDDGSVWTVGFEITNDKMIFDLTQAPEQSSGPYNTGRDGAMIVCQMFFKALTDPERFANAGSFAPLEVLTKPGTIFHAGPTAAHAYYFETRIRLFDALWHCMAKAAPGLLPAGHFASIFGTVIAGVNPNTGRRYTMVEPQMGGWGATPERPGTSAMYSTSHGDTFNCPVEIAEARYGFEVARKSLNLSPDLAGHHRGGHGIDTTYHLLADATISVGYSHGNIPVWSQENAPPGGTNSLVVEMVSGDKAQHRFASGLELKAGDKIHISTAYGGQSVKSTGRDGHAEEPELLPGRAGESSRHRALPLRSGSRNRSHAHFAGRARDLLAVASAGSAEGTLKQWSTVAFRIGFVRLLCQNERTQKAPLDDVNCRLALAEAFEYEAGVEMVAITDQVSHGKASTGAIRTGMLNGLDINIPILPSIRSKASVQPYSMFNYVKFHEELKEGIGFVMEQISASRFRPEIDRVFPYEKTVVANRHTEGNSQCGKFVVAVA